jgi:hypothetical protein
MKPVRKTFALEPGAPRRLSVTYPANLANAEVLLDGQKVLAFASKEEFQRGTTCKLPDGSILTVRFGPVEGMPVPIFKGVHVIRNGQSVAGSAADPVPKWAWVFIIACALIPVVTLGGALPALIGFGGVGGVLSICRMKNWSVALRAGVCAAVTLACWGGLGLLVTVVSTVKAGAGDQGKPAQAAIVSNRPAPTSTDKLIHKIGVAYYNHGYRQQKIAEIKDNLYDNCDRMQPAQCTDYLEKALVEAQNAADVQ